MDHGDEQDTFDRRELHLYDVMRSQKFARYGANDVPMVSVVALCGGLEPERFVVNVVAVVDCPRCLRIVQRLREMGV